MNLCKICQEPISNFICIDCLERDIVERMPEGLREGFAGFHRNISYHFHSNLDRFIPCLKCGLSDAPSICIPCYLNEVHSWFKENRLISKLKGNMSFDFEALKRNLKNHSALPITEIKSHRIKSGICDECGEYSESLSQFNLEWVCEGCKDIGG